MTPGDASSESTRPAVSVVMPFAGDRAAAAAALEALSRIERRPGDELLAVDNSAAQTLAALAVDEVRVIPATAQRSSYYARNVGAAAARNEWLLFIDSDCTPDPGILDRFFDEPVDEHVGAIAGEIAGDCLHPTAVARYQLDRGYLGQRRHIEDAPRPYAVTANVLVCARAWRSIGGFLEGIRSGGDTEFSWRLQDAGWRLAYRPEARVVHRHRESIRSFGRVIARYAAGRAWLNRRYPGAYPSASSVGSGFRALLAACRWRLAGERERAAFRLIDAFVNVVDRVGAVFANRSSQPASAAIRARVVVLTDRFPELSETFIGSELVALGRAGCPARVEAARRAHRQELAVARAHRVDYREDDPPLRKLRALAWLCRTHPARCAQDLLAQTRWRQEEDVPPLRVIAPVASRLVRGGESHLHAHFAGGAALTAMRVAQLTGRPYSVTAHAFEIFREPRNLREKLERASFVTTGCRYNVEQLCRLAPGARVHEIVMGVDGRRFRRRRPYPGGRSVIAVGRLVEKKGFRYLLAAAAMLERDGIPLERLEIVGDGPLRAELEEQVRVLGLQDTVLMSGAAEHDAVRDAIERADLLAMPCLIAGDGDRDSMPVVVKEALALEVPVVASREVGLLELVWPEFGRLVEPANAQELADAIAELLALDPVQREEMGRAGRAHVLEHCDVERESARLAELIVTGTQSTSIRCSTEARTMAAISTTSSTG